MPDLREYPVVLYPDAIPIPRPNLPSKPVPICLPKDEAGDYDAAVGCIISFLVIGSLASLPTILGPVIGVAAIYALRPFLTSFAATHSKPSPERKKWDEECSRIRKVNAQAVRDWKATCDKIQSEFQASLQNPDALRQQRRLYFGLGHTSGFHRDDRVGPTEHALFQALKDRNLRVAHQVEFGMGGYSQHMDMAVFDSERGLQVSIEADGSQHWDGSNDEQMRQDQARERWLLDRGWIVIRFTNDQIRANPRWCASFVEEVISNFDRQPIRVRLVEQLYRPWKIDGLDDDPDLPF